MTVRDYSTTANDNTTIEGIALADTMLANALDNAIRQEMADTANFLLDIAKPTATTGSANAYILSTGGTVDAYADKVRLAIRPNFSNTGACTINVDTVGVVDLKIYTSAGVGDLASGQIQSGGVYDILYVAALGDFVVLNPTPEAPVTNTDGYELIETKVLLNDATADFTGFDSSKYSSYEFVLSNVLPSTDAQYLRVRTSASGGAGYDSGVGDYGSTQHLQKNATISSFGSLAGSTFIVLSEAVGNAGSEAGVSGEMSIFGPHLTKYTQMMGKFIHMSSGTDLVASNITGIRNSAAIVDALQFFYSSGDIASGTITMYGKVNS